MTEKEAREKWCPFVRITERGTINRPSGIPGMSCIASDCMAWRWSSKTREPKVGYCGLAGKP